MLFTLTDFIHRVDCGLFAIINNFAGRHPWLDALARLFLNDYFIPTTFAVLLLALWFDETNSSRKRSTNQRAVLVGALSAALANTLLKIINQFYFRPRPFDVYEVNLLFYQPTDSSLPSNAAALGFSIAVGVWVYRQRWGWILLGLAAIFGLSRIFGGVHYPLDVISGAALGGASAWFIQQQQESVDKILILITRLATRLGLP